MSKERRFDEKEIATIFERAAKDLEASRQKSMTGEGLSLAELQEIGAESGIPADFIARAALALHRAPESHPVETFLGSPVGVARTLELPRKLTEEEWEALVVDLRTTFKAKGKIQQDGAFRQWTNGNLQFLLEPIGEGCRLRMKTVNANVRSGLVGGIVYMAIGFICALLFVLTSKAGPPLIVTMLLMFLAGLGLYGVNRYRVPRWASTRNQQMEDIGERLVSRMGLAEPEFAESAPKPAISIDDELSLPEEDQASTRSKQRS